MVKVRRHIQRTFGTEAEAGRYGRLVDDALRRADEAMRLGLSPDATLSEVLAPFLRSRTVKKRSYSAARLAAYRRTIGRFARELPSEVLTAITAEDVEDWVERRYSDSGYRGNPVRQGTVKAEVDMLLSVVRWAASRRQFVPSGAPVPLCTMERLSAGVPFVPPVYSIPELRAILRAVEAERPHIGLPLWCMFLAGVRPAAAVGLRWRDVRRPAYGEAGLVEFPALKGGRPLRRALDPEGALWGVLAGAYAIWERDYPGQRRKRSFVFPKASAAGGYSVKSFSREAARAGARVGAEGFVAYSVRHSVMTALRAAEVPEAARQHWAGHLDPATQRKYDHTTGAAAEDALAVVERWAARE